LQTAITFGVKSHQNTTVSTY